MAINEQVAEAIQIIGSQCDGSGQVDDGDDVQAIADAVGALKAYLDKQARARHLRLAGRINAAVQYEQDADAIYQRMRPECRW